MLDSGRPLDVCFERDSMLTPRCTALRLAGLASIGAGVIHAVVVPDHAATWWLSGVFFVLLALIQLAWGALVVFRPHLLDGNRGGRTLITVGVVVALGSAVLWALTRWVTGEPFGPQAGTELPIGPAGIASTVLEILQVVLLAVAARLSTTPARRMAVALVAAGSLLVVAPAAWGVDGALAHDHGSHDDADGHTDDDGHHGDGHTDDQGRHGDRRTDPPKQTTSPRPKTERESKGPASEPSHDDAHEDGHAH